MDAHRELAEREGRPFGNSLRLREEARDAWGWTWIDDLSQDLRYAARVLGKAPGFTAVAVSTLALGIGVNVAAFGFLNRIVLTPLPVRDPGSLLRFERRSPANAADNFPYAAVAFYRAHSTSLSAVLASSPARMALEGTGQRASAQFVTPNFFAELGGTAQLGRALDPALDGAADAEPGVVLSQGFWRRSFGGDPSVVGRTLRLDGKPAIVVGVASRRFSGLDMGEPDLWVSILQRPFFGGGRRALQDFSDNGTATQMWGRLRPGATARAAAADLTSLATALRREHPDGAWEGERLVSEPGGYPRIGRGPAGIYPILAFGAALTMLILTVACTNLGGLLLARGLVRRQEMGLRAALGAARGRLFRQLLTESLFLAGLGAAAGLALGQATLRWLVARAELPAWLEPTLDWRVTAFAGGSALMAAALFGLAPAWQGARQRYRSAMARQALIGGQVAASCVLLIVAGLLARALHHAATVPPGFEYRHVIVVDPHFEGAEAERARTHLEALEARLREVPGVVAVALATNPPLGNRWTVTPAEVGGHAVRIHTNGVTPGFFDAMKIPLRGRGLTVGGSPQAIVVSESLARLEWPGTDPLGQTLRLGKGANGADNHFTVVGVSGSARLLSPEDSDAVEVYRLPDASSFPSMTMVVRTSGPPEGLLRTVESIARGVDPRLTPEVRLMKAAFAASVRTSMYASLSAGLLGLVALLLACLGIAGLVAYAVSQLTKEIGIRMALGARRSHVLWGVLRQFSRPVVVGTLLGVGGAAALSQILRRVLYGVSPLDPMAYVAAVGVFGVAAATAALWPARRALRLDPTKALRYE